MQLFLHRNLMQIRRRRCLGDAHEDRGGGQVLDEIVIRARRRRDRDVV